MRTCNRKRQTKEHRDAEALIQFVFDQGGKDAFVTLTNDEIARRLGWVVDHGKGHFSADGSRYAKARVHAMEAIDADTDRPCLAYRLNYRKAGRGRSVLSLLDPTGGLGEFAVAAIGSVYGWATRQKQSATENRRMQEQLQRLADWVLAAEDKEGYRTLVAAQIELDHTGYLTPQTLGELISWAESAA
jgi:hypothetical protein